MKKITFLFCLFTLVSCRCLPQIPPQYLQANTSCEAYLPNYLVYITVINNCGDATLAQNPVPGTILNATNPAVEVTLTATNEFGNTDIEKFDVFLWDAPQIIWDSIPGDTLPIVDKDTELMKAFYSLLNYDIEQGHNERFPGDSILVKNDSIHRYVVWSMEME